MKVNGKVAIVTGASWGIGESTARLLTQRGARVALVARSLAKLEELSRELPESCAVAADISDPKAVRSMLDEVLERYGRVDILVNNAGRGLYGPIEEIDLPSYRHVWELNVLGALRLMQLVAPEMRESGGGAIVNISSMTSVMHIPNLGAYAATKAALNTLTLTAREELAKDNISVSLVMPGLVDTDFGRNALKFGAAALGMESRRRPNLKDPYKPHDVAAKILEAIETGAERIEMPSV